MLLGFTHKDNKIAPLLLSYIQSQGPTISQKEILIEEYTYANVLVKCGTSDSSYIINSPQAVQKNLDSQYVSEMLDINGIRYNENHDDNITKIYQILIWDRLTISVLQKGYGRGSGKSKYIDEEPVKKIVELAKRAIYVLGLDYGMVIIGLTSNRKMQVMSVEDSPVLREKDFYKILKNIAKLIENTNHSITKEVKLGADPEFMLSNTKTGKMVPASQFFPRDGLVGCDAIRTQNRQQRPIAELRPQPTNSPHQLVNNLEEALQSAYKMAPYKNVKWLAGSRPFKGYSIGGHIHFSNIELNNHILRALDNYLALPLFLIENQKTAVKRRLKYGYLADYRVKEYGGFEYRTLASWLVSPKIATAVLCLGKIVASNYLQLTRNCFLSVEAQQAFYDGDQEYLKTCFNDIWQDIQKLEDYQDYQEELQIIFDMVKNDTKWNEREDLRQAWAISSRNNKKRNLNMPEDTRFRRRTSTRDLSNRDNRSGRNQRASASVPSSYYR